MGSKVKEWQTSPVNKESIKKHMGFELCRHPVSEKAIHQWFAHVNQHCFRPKIPAGELRKLVEWKIKNTRCDGDRTAVFVPYHHEESMVLEWCLHSMDLQLRWNELGKNLETAPLTADDSDFEAWTPMTTAGQFHQLRSDIKRNCFYMPELDDKGAFIPRFGKKQYTTPVSFSAGQFMTAIYAGARRNSVNPLLKWLEDLPQWDTRNRIDTLFQDCGFTVADDTIAAFAARNILFGMVNRAIEPGCRHDEMVILYGAQGIGKSRFWANLVPHPSLFSDDFSFGSDGKVRTEKLQGKWVMEAAELSGFGTRDWTEIFAFLSRPTDRMRLAYDRTASDFPRATLLGGTTNDEGHIPFINGGQGNRRFISLEVGGIIGETSFSVVRYLQDNSIFLFAEALERVRRGETALISGEIHRTIESTNLKRANISIVYLEHHEGLIAAATGGLTIRKACEICDQKYDHINSIKMANALKHMGFRKSEKKHRHDGKRSYLWYHPESPKKPELTVVTN